MNIYIVRAANGFHKIGISNNPNRRAEAIATSSPFAVQLAHHVECDPNLARRIEMRAHALLKTKRVNGEWFDCSTAEALEAVAFAEKNPLMPEPKTYSYVPVRKVQTMQSGELKAIRKELGLTQDEMGAALGLTKTFIGMMERGDKPIERRTALAALYLRDNPSAVDLLDR